MMSAGDVFEKLEQCINNIVVEDEDPKNGNNLLRMLTRSVDVW